MMVVDIQSKNGLNEMKLKGNPIKYPCLYYPFLYVECGFLTYFTHTARQSS